MNVWLVSAVYGRPAVTRLAMRQWAHLQGELAGRGITLGVVVVGDDENLDTAREFGFATLERPNVLGAKINAGIEYAAGQGADWICWAGSDNWVHPDLVLAAVALGGVVAGRSLAVVDLERQRLRLLDVNSAIGAPPWLIRRDALASCGFRPVDDWREHGLDGNLAWTLRGTPWHFVDPHPFCRVDFKGPESMSSYRILQHLGRGPERDDPFEALAERYPADLARLAAETLVAA